MSGRSRTEPFDEADQALLDAVAAVGAGAMSNAFLYDEVRHQRERLSAITSSLGEGVCAISPRRVHLVHEPYGLFHARMGCGYVPR